MISQRIAKLLAENGGKLPPYAFPGGYAIQYVTSDGGVLCAKCADEQIRKPQDEAEFNVLDFFVHWEGPALTCECCNEPIKAEYGDPDSDEED